LLIEGVIIALLRQALEIAQVARLKAQKEAAFA